MSELIQIKAIIVNYTTNAMHDSFDDGEFEFYDATEIRIVAPKDFEGQKLSIYHTGKVSENSLWRIINQRIMFDINKNDFVEEMTLFDGAVLNLCAVE
ncbi:MAG: hypothetical protein DRR16_09475 [Candidatus Parabeggiatoa sp. nov. 3]|mgnify:CR=1 FL=1|jgi:hypothetical protein|nr:MAG: hypothetical protein DRR00_15625 [Gammaproteobacteria bacterium]RKZ65697.1 MAG: hypothetical protein DRQ99_11895 [Gammaproteobacteria bacterium]RKZ86544.1 MAG: hypothetical protein DRR16_09475 [Gammaproteobacteria bacterium]